MKAGGTFILLVIKISMLAAQVPEKVKHSFEFNYPYVTDAVWETFNDGCKVTFTGVKNLKQKIEYSKEGVMIARYRELQKEEFPMYVAEYLSNYPAKNSVTVWMKIMDSGYTKFLIQNSDTIWEVKSARKNNKYVVEYIK
jgi:hypothetical protein